MESLDSDIPNYDFLSLWPDELWDRDYFGGGFMHQAGTSGESLPAMSSDPQGYVDLEPCHQERLMKEAEGLFVGVNLLNEMEPLEDVDMPDLSREYSAETEAIADFTYNSGFSDGLRSHLQHERPCDAQKSLLNIEIKKTNLEIYGEQLNVLRILRAKFIVQHRKFLQRTANEPSERIQELRRNCRRYEDLLDVGLLTFKAIMAGKRPSTLKEVFAFITLSCVMVGTMQARGKPVEFYINRWEVSMWGASIGDLEDCFALLKLIPLVWPEVEDSVRRDNPYSLSDVAWERFSRDILTESRLAWQWETKSPMHSTAHRLLGETSVDDNFCFSDWLNLFPVDDTSGFQDNRFSEKLLQTNPLSDPSLQQHLISSQSDAEKTDWPGGTNTPEQMSDLAQTALFMQAITFLIFLGSLGILLICLGVGNQTSSSTGTYTFTTANTARFTQFLEVAKYRILNPLCLDSSLLECHPLFRTTTKVLEAGWLRSVRDIEIYLLCITKLFANCQVSYLSAISKILACALNASQDKRIDHEYLYQNGHQEVNNYSTEYVSQRTYEEAAILTEEAAILDQYGIGFENTNGGMNGDNELSLEVEMADLESFKQELASERSSGQQNYSLSPITAASSTTFQASPFHSVPSHATQTIQAQPIILHCPIPGCRRKYTGPDSRSNLARHKREQHSSRAAFACKAPGCGHVSKRLHNLRAHWRLRHWGPEGAGVVGKRRSEAIGRVRDRNGSI